MARTKKLVDSNEVRSWANDTGWTDELDRPVADRGRMPSGLIEDFNKANARYNKEYVPIPRPQRSDQRGGSQSRTERTPARASRSTSNADSTPARSTAKAEKPSVQTAPVESVSTPDDAERMELEAAIAAFSALPADKKNGRPVLVTTKIQTLRYV